MNQAIKTELMQAMNSTWDTIGGDCLAMSDGTMDKETVIEMVLDANRLEQYGDLSPEALAAFQDMEFNDTLELANQAFTYETYGY